MHRSALLVMDFQEGVVARLGSSEVVDAAARAVDAARANGIPVVFVRVAFRPGYPEVHPRGGFAGTAASAGAAMTEQGSATQVVAALAPREDEPVVVKRRISAFSGSDLEILLRALDVEQLVLAGISTSGVVLSTVRQAFDLDYRLTVLRDACADRDPELHALLMERLLLHQATVQTVDDWVASAASS